MMILSANEPRRFNRMVGRQSMKAYRKHRKVKPVDEPDKNDVSLMCETWRYMCGISDDS